MCNFKKCFDKDEIIDKAGEFWSNAGDMFTNALAQTKLNELLHKEEPKKKNNGFVIALAVIGAVAAVAGIAYCVYRFMFPDYLEEFDEEDDLEDAVEEEEK